VSIDAHDQRRILVGSCILFVGIGFLTSVLGPLLPELSTLTHASLAEMGGLFTAFSLGALLAQLISGPVSDRVGYRGVLAVGSAGLAIGIVALSASTSLALVLGCAVFAGLGMGTVDLCTNLLVAHVYAERSVPALNLLNLFFGLGAFAGPALVGLAWATSGSGIGVLWLGAAVMAAMVLWVLLEVPSQADHAAHAAVKTDSSIYRSSLLWIFSLLLLLYVGLENGIGGWTTVYMQQTTPLNAEAAALVTSSFWLALTAGRLISAGIGSRLQPQVVLGISLTGAVLGGGVLAAGRGSTVLSIAAVVIIGLSFGAVFPTVVAMLTAVFRRAPGRATSIATSAGSIGGMLLPALQGVVLERIHPYASAWFVAGGNVLMLLVFMAIVGRYLAVSTSKTGYN
jgi:MFS transporter, FHS family, glucose/mannose:H+ symporter